MAGSTIFTLAWVKGMGERALASFAQGALLGIGLSGAAGSAEGVVVPDILALPWYAALSTGLAMALLSGLTSLLRPDFVAGQPAEPPVVPPYEGDDEGDEVDESEADIEPQRALDDEGDEVAGDDPDAYVDVVLEDEEEAKR